MRCTQSGDRENWTEGRRVGNPFPGSVTLDLLAECVCKRVFWKDSWAALWVGGMRREKAYSMGYTVIHCRCWSGAWQAMEFSFPPSLCNRLSCRLQTHYIVYSSGWHSPPSSVLQGSLHKLYTRPEILWSKWNHLMNSTRIASQGDFSIIFPLQGGRGLKSSDISGVSQEIRLLDHLKSCFVVRGSSWLKWTTNNYSLWSRTRSHRPSLWQTDGWSG